MPIGNFLGTTMKDNKIVIARLWPRYKGGVTSRAGVIMGLDSNRFRTIFIYLMKSSNEPNFFEQKGCTTYYLSKKKFLRVLNPGIIYKLVKILKDEKVDIVHCHQHQATTYGNIAAIIAKKPVVIAHVHGLNRSKNPRRKFANQVTLRWVNKILTVGEAVRGDVIKANPGVRPEKIVSIGNSIDCNRFAKAQITKAGAKEKIGLEPNSFVFGTVGRLAPTKGYSYLITAFARAKRQIPSAHLVLVGDGRLRSNLEKVASETAAADSIHFLGRRDDISQLLKAMDVFVISSIAEGLPRTLLEAMAGGVLCIGTNVGGVSEILADGEFGCLVLPKNESTLAEAMIKLARTPEKEQQKLIDNARKRVYTCYDHRVLIKKIENIYETEYSAAAN